MTTSPFARDPSTVDQALTIAGSRRAAAIAARTKAASEVEVARRILEHAEFEHATREEHVRLCNKQMDGLLDERLLAVQADEVVSA